METAPTNAPAPSAPSPPPSPSPPPPIAPLKWRAALSTPSRSHPKFSPARELFKADSYAGLGLTIAQERSKEVSRCGKLLVQLLEDSASNIDSYSLKLRKGADNLNLEDTSMVHLPLTADFTDTLIKLSKQTLFLSMSTKQNVARPLSGTYESSAAAHAAPFKAYVSARQQCLESRRSTIAAHKAYRKAVKDCEAAALEAARYRRTSASASSSSSSSSAAPPSPGGGDAPLPPRPASPPAHPLPPPSLPFDSQLLNHGIESLAHSTSSALGLRLTSSPFERLRFSVSSLKTSAATYRLCVGTDAASGEKCGRAEGDALDRTEEVERERAKTVIDTLDRQMQSEHLSLINMAAILEKYVAKDKHSGPQNPSSEPPSASLPSSTQSSAATMDAPTLSEVEVFSAPSAAGLLRSALLASLRRAGATHAALTAIRKVADVLAAASDGLATSDLQTLCNNGYASNAGSSGGAGAGGPPLAADSAALATSVLKWEGNFTGLSVNAVTTSIRALVDGANGLAKDLRDVSGTILPASRLAEYEKSLKFYLTNNEQSWRTVCSACRDLSRAEGKLQAAETEAKRLGDRVAAIRQEWSSEESSARPDLPPAPPQPPGGNEALNDGLQKALGFVLSSLGGSSDVLSKVTTKKQRLEMAGDACRKAEGAAAEAKALAEAARKVAAERVEVFTRQSEEAISYLKEDEVQKQTLVRTAMGKIVGAHADFLAARVEAVKAAEETLQAVQKEGGAIADSNEWAKKVAENIAKKFEMLPEIFGEVADADACKVDFVLESSYVVSKLLELSDSSDVQLIVAAGADTSGKPGASLSDEEISALAELIKDTTSAAAAIASSTANTANENADADESSSAAVETRHFPKVAAFAAALLPPSKALEQQAFASHFGSIASGSGSGSREEEGKAVATATSGDEAGERSPTTSESREGGSNAEEDTSQIVAPSAAVIESFSCCYWKDEKDHSTESKSLISSPLLHGRMFVTADAIYFVGWGHSKIILDMVECKSIQKEKAVLADNAISIQMKDGKNYFFGSFAFRENCFQLVNRLISIKSALIEAGMVADTSKAAKSAAVAGNSSSSSSSSSSASSLVPATAVASLPPVPDDVAIKSMDIVVKERLKISVSEFFTRFWEESESSGRFYGDWLLNKGSKEVSVSAWEEGSFPHKFSGASYTKKRRVKFLHPRTTHLWIGPPLAGVQQDQYVQLSPDRCVVVMTVEMSGIPYADVFAVEVRWVATRSATDTQAVEVLVGVTVDFKKSTIMKSNIRSGTLEETASTHQLLFKAMENSLAARGGGGGGGASGVATAAGSRGVDGAPIANVADLKALSGGGGFGGTETSSSLLAKGGGGGALASAENLAAKGMRGLVGQHGMSISLLGAILLVLWLWMEMRSNRTALLELSARVESLTELLKQANSVCTKK